MRIHKLFPLCNKLFIKNNNYPHCNRDICYCLYELNLNKKEDRDYYKECYQTWFHMFGK